VWRAWCSVTTESDFFMPSFKFSVFCEICLIKYANFEYIFRIVDNIVRELCTLYGLLRPSSCVVDPCLILLRMSKKYGVSTGKVGYVYLISFIDFYNYRFKLLEVCLFLYVPFGYTKNCKA